MSEQEGGGAEASPRPCIVAGNAHCLFDDLDRARDLYPDAVVIAVNGAAREVKASVLFSFHPERFIEAPYEWIRHQTRRFGPGFTVHGANRDKHGDLPWVDRWWPEASGGGGSAWGARKVARFLGLSPVILCGCPLVPGNYTHFRPGLLMTRQEVTGQYADEIASDTEWHEGALSMSGRTLEILGAP